MIDIRRLNIFVDETGEFGFEKDASKMYGVSFTFHEQNDNINDQLARLNDRLSRIGFTDMIHMAYLVANRNEYSILGIEKRKQIFYSIFEFSKRAKVKYKTILINKSYTDSNQSLENKLIKAINIFINDNYDYISSFDNIVLYYDNGQKTLCTILESILYRFEGFVHKSDFNHVEKRLFQVSDMLTFVDKLQYKYKNNIPFTKNENFFFTKNDLRRIMKELDKKRM